MIVVRHTFYIRVDVRGVRCLSGQSERLIQNKVSGSQFRQSQQFSSSVRRLRYRHW